MLKFLKNYFNEISFVTDELINKGEMSSNQIIAHDENERISFTLILFHDVEKKKLRICAFISKCKKFN